MFFQEDVVVALIVVPVVLSVLRLAFTDEINYWVGAFLAYSRRPFDIDRNPRTHDWCQLFNGANGEWSTVSLTYKFGLFRGRNGVYVHYYDDKWSLVRVERVPFAQWNLRSKARLNISNLPEGLEAHIAKTGSSEVQRHV